jgi:hypothetical protein
MCLLHPREKVSPGLRLAMISFGDREVELQPSIEEWGGWPPEKTAEVAVAHCK